jgi:hypothetical protein
VLNGSVQVSSANTLGPNGTKLFDIHVNFATPFYYDPALGNLLVDSRTLAGGNRPRHTIDGTRTLGDTVSSIRTLFGNGGAAVANSNDTYGTIMQFSISPVPEAPSRALALLGLGGLLAFVRFRPKTRS